MTGLARENSRIIAWKQDGKVFSEGLRAEVFNEFRHLAEEGDWWLQLNADEFYDNDPHEFLGRVPSQHNFVWGITIEFYITQEDLQQIDFSLPFEAVRPMLKYYNVTWSEPRAFRHRKGLVWSPEWAWPRHAGLVATERLKFKHYPYRSPQQIQLRLDLRRAHRALGFKGSEHASQMSWKEKIALAHNCLVDDGPGDYQIEESRLPRHIEPSLRRLLKTVMHTTGFWP